MGAPSQADVRRIELEIEAEESQAEVAISPPSTLPLFDRFLEFVTPESHAESIVNQVYSSPARTLQPDPVYNRYDLSSPNVYVAAKGVVSDTVSAIKGFAGFGIAGVAIFALVAIAIYAAIPALIRR